MQKLTSEKRTQQVRMMRSPQPTCNGRVGGQQIPVDPNVGPVIQPFKREKSKSAALGSRHCRIWQDDAIPPWDIEAVRLHQFHILREKHLAQDKE